MEWFDDLGTVVACDFLLRWPTLDAVQRARGATLERFLRGHRSIRKETNARRLAEIRVATALTTDRAVIGSSVLMIKAWAVQMKTLIAAVTEFDREIDEVFRQHQDFLVFDSPPGAGPVYASRLCAAFGTDRRRWGTVEELLCLSGVAPVIERSGKSEWIRWRHLRPEVFAAVFCRVRRGLGASLVLGESLLPAAAKEGEVAPGGGSCFSFQVDPDHLEVLAGEEAVR